MEGYASGVNAYCGRTLSLRASRAPCARAEHAAVMHVFNKKYETASGGGGVIIVYRVKCFAGSGPILATFNGDSFG